MADSFTCPRCGRTSHHPDDIREGYCGACHDWTGQRYALTAGHTHLDQQRRPRGQCPACDQLWARQDDIIEARHWDEVAAQHGKQLRRQLYELGDHRYGRPR